jgi:hypothetical protein
MRVDTTFDGHALPIYGFDQHPSLHFYSEPHQRMFRFLCQVLRERRQNARCAVEQNDMRFFGIDGAKIIF